MKIPVLSSGKTSDYLCCIGRGMIQFVCTREGKGRNSSYSSLTAEKIIIHPGSVMFRMDPQYIVAGEIIKTTRMYAMSVSPLSPELIQKIMPQFISPARLSDGSHDIGIDKKKSLKTRDFTNNILIAGKIFEIKSVKGKKIVILPWENLSKITDELPTEIVYKGLKGCIVFQNQYNCMNGEKIDLILSIINSIDIENTFSRKVPGKNNYNFHTDREILLCQLENLAKTVKMKSKTKEIGFLSLFTDGKGVFWFKASRNIHTSHAESLSSLESLIDELEDEIDIEFKQSLNNCYRRLSKLLE